MKTEEGERRGKGKGKGSQFDIINHADQGVAKQVRRETSRQLCPLSTQIIAKAKPTPTSKLHSVTKIICKQKQDLNLNTVKKQTPLHTSAFIRLRTESWRSIFLNFFLVGQPISGRFLHDCTLNVVASAK